MYDSSAKQSILTEGYRGLIATSKTHELVVDYDMLVDFIHVTPTDVCPWWDREPAFVGAAPLSRGSNDRGCGLLCRL